MSEIIIQVNGNLRRIPPGSIKICNSEFGGDYEHCIETPWVDIEKILNSGITKEQFSGRHAINHKYHIPKGAIVCPECNNDDFVIEEGIDWSGTACSQCKKSWSCMGYSWAIELFKPKVVKCCSMPN